MSEVLGVKVETARRMTEGMALATLVVAAKNGKNLPNTGGIVQSATGKIVQSRINIANDRTRFTPIRPATGEPVSAGFNHVLEGHFNRPVANSRSVFNVTPDELKKILQNPSIVSSPVTAIPGGQFVRTVDVGRVIGTTSLKEGGVPTSVIKVFTDKAGNLITTYPVKGEITQ